MTDTLLKYDPKSNTFTACRLDTARPVSFASLKAEPHRAVYVFPLEILDRVRRFTDVVIDRGRKNPHKGLSDYLLGHDRIPVVDGNYAAAGQVRRSVRALLNRAAAAGDENVYGIGVTEEIFSELAAECRPEPTLTEPTSQLLQDSDRPKPTSPPDVKKDAPISAVTETPPADDALTGWLLGELQGKTPVPMHLASRFVGRSAEAVLVRQLIAIAAKTETPVLILGDTGTGKEVVAREIHRNGARKNRKFITVNCGAIPRELFESELFGHMPGAFTGAERRKQGLWESAENGTLFLDEIGDLSPEHQVKILRALEERRIRPVGASEDITAAPRVIAATNRDLFSMVRRGGFREDLYYRLRGFFIHTPALRDHPADIPLIAAYLWERIAPDAPPLTGEVLESMAGYPWPGNARELKMVLLHMYTLFGGVQATVEHLRAVFQIEGKTTTSAEPVDGEREIILHRAECLRHLKRVHEVIHAARYVLAQVSNATKPDENALESVHGAVIRRLRELEQLCRHPLRFHSEKTFSAVRRLTENTAFISGLVNAGANGAERRFSAEIHGAFDAAMTAVFHEIESLMAEGKP